MTETNGKKALHVATFSGWYRFEQNGKAFRQTKRDLSYWTLTCMSVDPENPQKIYAGSEHSGLFYTETAGKNWHRAEPNTPKMMLFSALALNGSVMVGRFLPRFTAARTVVGRNWKGFENTAPMQIFRPVRSFNLVPVISPMIRLRPRDCTPASRS